MKKLMTSFLVFFLFPLFGYGYKNGLVQENSPEQRLISKALEDVLTTPVGCRIAESFFLLRAEPMVQYFGMDKKTAKNIAQKCPGTSMPALAFRFSVPTQNRPAKTYELFIGSKNTGFTGWTSASNKTSIYLESLDEAELRRILAHEILITMDDKFHMQTSAFEKLGVKADLPAAVSCRIDRFLANPFHRILMASLRAFRMELLFAQELKDDVWMRQLSSYPFLSTDSVKNYEIFQKVMQGYEVSVTSFYEEYKDACTGQVFKIKSLQKKDLVLLAQRDWQEVQKALNADGLKNLMDLLLQSVAISTSNSNVINTGPRPVIGTNGWSNEAFSGRSFNVSIPQRDLKLDRSAEWEAFHKGRLDEVRQNMPQASEVPVLEFELLKSWEELHRE